MTAASSRRWISDIYHPQFADLIQIVADEQGIAPALVEKDYWIIQSPYGLQQLGLAFGRAAPRCPRAMG